jgi:hypothetical protein
VGEGQPTGHPSTVRVSVQEAADRLGTTVDAIRKRVQRGTVAHEKDSDGRVWILLDVSKCLTLARVALADALEEETAE